MLNPAILLSSARTIPRRLLLKTKYCCSVNVASIHAYLSTRLPVNSTSTLPSRNPLIASGVSVCTFSIRIRIHFVAWQTHNFGIILYWKQARFQDHLILYILHGCSFAACAIIERSGNGNFHSLRSVAAAPAASIGRDNVCRSVATGRGENP